MEFFSREIQRPDADLLEMMTVIGSQIGQCITHLVKPIDEQHLLGVLAALPRPPDSPRRPP